MCVLSDHSLIFDAFENERPLEGLSYCGIAQMPTWIDDRTNK